MASYQMARVPRLTIGAGTRRGVAELASGLVPAGASVLLVADPGLEGLGHPAEAAAALRRGGFTVATFTDIKSDPTLAQAEAAAQVARDAGASLLVAMGGGSALDLGKAVAAVAGAAAPASHYALCAAPLPTARLRTIVLPTTAGTGSETTRTAILSAADGAKLWFWGEELKPDEVVLDPELTVTLPAGLTAATGLDALVHAVEAATNRNANPGNDAQAHEAIRLVARHLETAVRDPGDIPAREALQRGAALAGIAIDNAGTAIAHTIGHALASLRPIHHGRAVGVAMRASLPWVVAGAPEAFARCAAAMGAEASPEGFVSAYGALMERAGLAPGLGPAFDAITPEALAAQMARPENMPMVRSTRREAGEADLLGLARATLAA